MIISIKELLIYLFITISRLWIFFIWKCYIKKYGKCFYALNIKNEGNCRLHFSTKMIHISTFWKGTSPITFCCVILCIKLGFKWILIWTTRPNVTCSSKRSTPFSALLLPRQICQLMGFQYFVTNWMATIRSQFSTPIGKLTTLTTTHLLVFLPSSLRDLSFKTCPTCHPTTCQLDPIQSHLLQTISPSVVPALIHIINTPLHSGRFPVGFNKLR